VDRFILEAHLGYFIKNLSTEKKKSLKAGEISNNKSEFAPKTSDKGLKIRDNLLFPYSSRDKDETHLPAFENTPSAYPRLFGSHENTRRSCRDQRAPRQRP